MKFHNWENIIHSGGVSGLCVCVCNNLVMWYVGGSRMSEKWNRIFTIAFSICFVCSLSSSSHNRISLSSWFQLCYFQLSLFHSSSDVRSVVSAWQPVRCADAYFILILVGSSIGWLGRRTWRTVAKFNFRFPIYTIHIHVLLPMIIYYYFCLSTNCVRYDMTVDRIGHTRTNARDSCWWGCWMQLHYDCCEWTARWASQSQSRTFCLPITPVTHEIIIHNSKSCRFCIRYSAFLLYIFVMKLVFVWQNSQ